MQGNIVDEANHLFSGSVFPAYLSGLRTQKSRQAAVRLIDDFELLCGKPFLLADDTDGTMYAKIVFARYKTTTACMRLSSILSIAAFCERYATVYMNSTCFESYKNPFSNLRRFATFCDYVDSNSVPTPEQLDHFLCSCNDEVALIVALIAKCGLPSRYIRTLRLNDMEIHEARHYMRIISHGQPYLLLVPEDVADMILNYCSANEPSTEGTIFKNRYGHMMSERVIEQHYRKQADACGFNYSMQDLRNAAAAFMIAGGASREDVARYLGITQIWNRRFDRVRNRVASFDAADYSMLTIKQKI